MNKREDNLPPAYVADSCAGAQLAALKLLDCQTIGEPSIEAKRRLEIISKLTEAVHSLAEGSDLGFCQGHCRPDSCVVHTGETIPGLNARTLRTTGTKGRSKLLDDLKASDQIQNSPADAVCPYLSEAMPPTLIEDLARGVKPGNLIEIGYTDEHPHTPGQTVLEVVDPERILARSGSADDF